ncbi:hypothetical protein GYA13_00925 [Candidatus Kuenenbacteria bacterium]|nr:hypothetical protein [Candidatus Kuenenbacteria bacterium]
MGLFSSPLEKQLERHYADMFINMIGLPPIEAEKTVKEMIYKAKQIVQQTGEDKFPPDMAERIINDPKMKPTYDRRKNEGVKDEDIRWWWGLQPLERYMMLQVDEFYRMTLFIKEIQDGKSAEEAAAMVRKYHPDHGDPNKAKVSGDDAPLPEELKDRINIYIEKRATTDPEQYKKDIENSSTFNALIRKEIKAGLL